MALEYTLLIRKSSSGSAVKSSLTDFGFAVCSSDWPDEETQELAVRKWPGENGEDAYIPPQGLKLEAYDLSVDFCYKGAKETAYSAYTKLRSYLIGEDGNGAELIVYDPYWKKGRKGVYVKKFADIDAHRSNIDEVMEVKVTFRVTDPITDITLSYVGD